MGYKDGCHQMWCQHCRKYIKGNKKAQHFAKHDLELENGKRKMLHPKFHKGKPKCYHENGFYRKGRFYFCKICGIQIDEIDIFKG